jgi:hypothetical protein
MFLAGRIARENARMTLPATIDRVARRIAAALQRDGRQSAQQLADNVGLSATPVWRRSRGAARRSLRTGRPCGGCIA